LKFLKIHQCRSYDKRKDEFDSLFIKNIPVIFDWGVSKNLQYLAENAIKAIDADNSICLQKNGLDLAYYHPLPHVYS